MAALNLATVTSTPAATPPRPKANALTADWTLGCRSETDSQSSRDEEAAESTSEIAMSAFTDAMEKLNLVATGAGRVIPLTFQLKSTWEEAKEHEKEICIGKATEACTLVCDIIAPKVGQQLFQACFTPDKGTSYLDLVPLCLQQRHDEYLEDPNSKPICVSISSEDTSENPRAILKVKRVAN